jgi:hypothetical protein
MRDHHQPSQAFLEAQEKHLEALRKQVLEAKKRRAQVHAQTHGSVPVIERLFVGAAQAGRPI